MTWEILNQIDMTTLQGEFVEVAYKLNIDVRKADQQIRGAMVLPNGTGKTQRVLVFARGAKA